jgi:hypothetical protein
VGAGVEHLLATPLTAEAALRPLCSDRFSGQVQHLPSTRYLPPRDPSSGRGVPKEVQLNLLLQGQVLQIIAALDFNSPRSVVQSIIRKGQLHSVTRI